jgi:hypothetical protein
MLALRWSQGVEVVCSWSWSRAWRQGIEVVAQLKVEPGCGGCGAAGGGAGLWRSWRGSRWSWGLLVLALAVEEPNHPRHAHAHVNEGPSIVCTNVLLK